MDDHRNFESSNWSFLVLPRRPKIGVLSADIELKKYGAGRPRVHFSPSIKLARLKTKLSLCVAILRLNKTAEPLSR